MDKFFGHKKTRMAGNKVDLEIGDGDGCFKEIESSSYSDYIWQYFTVSNSSDPEKSGAKLAVCKILVPNLQWLMYLEGSSPHFGEFCIRPSKSWNTGMYHHKKKMTTGEQF